MKRCSDGSISLIIRKIQMKATMRYQLIPIRKTFTEKQTRVGEDVEKLEPFCIVSENVKWCSNHGSSMAAPQNLNKVPKCHFWVYTQKN